MNLKSIFMWIFMLILVFFVVVTAGLQYFHPEWFIVRENTSPITYLSEKYDATKAPHLVCDGPYATKCHYVNVPTDTPFIVQTSWRWLYVYRYLFISVMTVLGIIINWEKLKIWKQKIMSSN